MDINAFQKEAETEIFWDAKSCQEDGDIHYHSDTEEEQFWDSLASPDDDINTQIEVKSEVVLYDKIERLAQTQTGPDEND